MKNKQPLNYIKPKITSKKIKTNHFYGRRFSDGMDLLGGLADSRILAQSGACGCCFAQDAAVLMSKDDTRAIKEIKKGDRVSSFNLEKNKLSESKVVEKIVHIDAKIRYIILNQKIKTTSEHPFWVNGEKWKRAKEIKVGDWLLTSSGEKVTISGLDSYSAVETVYNLELEDGDHNYFVENVLVHNQR